MVLLLSVVHLKDSDLGLRKRVAGGINQNTSIIRRKTVIKPCVRYSAHQQYSGELEDVSDTTNLP